VSIQWDPISFTVKVKVITYFNFYFYLKNVLYWPEDDRLRSKHVAIM